MRPHPRAPESNPSKKRRSKLATSAKKEKNEISKEVVVLQDRLKDNDRELIQQRKELKAYEEERSFIQRFMPTFFALLYMYAETWRLWAFRTSR